MATYNIGRVAYVNKGAYNAATVYEDHDVVLYQNGSYTYINGTPASGNVPTNATYWKVMLDPTAMNAATETANSAGTYIGPEEPESPLKTIWLDTNEPDLMSDLNATQALLNGAVGSAEAARDLASGYADDASDSADEAAASAAQLAAGVASPAGTYADLAALISANPDHSKIYITLDDGHWAYYDAGTSAFVDSGYAWQAAALSVLLEEHNFMLGGVGTANGTLSTSTTRIRTDLIDLPSAFTGSVVTFETNSTYLNRQAVGYLNGAYVKALTVTGTGSSRTIPFDGTYNQVRLAQYKTDNAEFTAEEAEATYVKIKLPAQTATDALFSDVNTLTALQKQTHRDVFEYGGVGVATGDLVDNLVRVRSMLIKIPDGYDDAYLYLKTNSTYIEIAIPSYLDGVWVSNLTSASIDGFIVIPYNANYNELRLTYGKVANAEFTPAEVTELYADLYLPTQDSLRKTLEVALQGEMRGKKLADLGDSLTYGYIPRNCTGYPGQLNSYSKLAAKYFSMAYDSNGIAGSSVTNIAGRNPMCIRFADLPDDADIVTFMGGTNDVRNGAILGVMSDRVDSTFYGALHLTMAGLYKKYFIDQSGAGKKIIVITPLKLLATQSETEGGTGVLVDWETWVDAIKEVTAYYSFPVLDMYNLCQLNPHLNQTLEGTEEGYTGWWNPYMPDGTHPTQDGQQMMADVLIGFLRTLM
jgi:lysophospholipase L1-like esterase